MNKILLWIKAMRAPFFTASIIPVIIGSLLAWNEGFSFNWTIFGLTLAMAVFVHAGVNLLNDYYDHKSGNDKANKNFSQFNGGSRVIQDKLLKASQILYASIIFLTLGFCIGIYLNMVVPGDMLIRLALSGIALGFFYSAGPFRFSYHSLGEIAVAVSFGPLLVMFSYYALSARLSLNAFLLSLPVAFLIFLILFINEFQDYDADKKTKKKTLLVVFGKKKATMLYAFGIVMTYVTLIFASFKIGYFLLLGLLSLPLAAKAYGILLKNYDKIKELLPANGMTIGLHMITGLLIIAGLILEKLI